MNGKQTKKIKREIKKNMENQYRNAEKAFFINVLNMPFRERFAIAWRIIRGKNKNV